MYRVTGPLCGEFTGHAGLRCCLWSAPWINGWKNNRETGDLRRHRGHFDVIVEGVGSKQTLCKLDIYIYTYIYMYMYITNSPDNQQLWGSETSISHKNCIYSNLNWFELMHKMLFDLLHHINIWQASVLLSCGSTNMIWMWYSISNSCLNYHDDVIKWNHFLRYWPFVRGIHRSPVNSPHKGQWRGALMFSLICLWINGWVNNGEAGDLRRYRGHYDVIVMSEFFFCHTHCCLLQILQSHAHTNEEQQEKK